MRELSNTARSTSSSDASGEIGDFTTTFTRQDYQDLIRKANSVPLVSVFKYYGVRLNEMNKKTTCPFKSHAGGRERTPSFYYYHETNSYCCFGCGVGSRGCDFVAEMEGISKVAAAHKILQLFGSEADVANLVDRDNFAERLEIMLDFSTAVREFRQKYTGSEAEIYIEQACIKYDELSAKRNPNNEALRRIVDQLKEYINLYNPCPTL